MYDCKDIRSIEVLINFKFNKANASAYFELPTLTQKKINHDQLSKAKHETNSVTDIVRTHQKPSWKSLYGSKDKNLSNVSIIVRKELLRRQNSSHSVCENWSVKYHSCQYLASTIFPLI